MEYLDNKQRYKKQREAGTTISHAYDLHGNILALRRNGRLYGSVYGVTDDLTYEYDGNRLTKVTNLAPERPAYKDAMYYVDGADLDTERTYDANGNMVSDADRQITHISYDRQNLPRRTDYLDGSHVDYTYDADGVKLRVDYYLSPYIMVPGDEFGIAVDSTQLVHTWREYVGNCVYENDTLHMVLIDGGYIPFAGASPQPLYHYYAKDYLGNNRVVTDEAGRIEEINHYYPFGGLMGDSHNTATQPYKYIGKELNRTHGLDWYDHGARHYDPVTGRWNVVDAMAEKYYPWSPYVSCVDNPVRVADLNGCDTINIAYNVENSKWVINNVTKAKGDDIFNVLINDKSSSYVFSDGKYGERVNCLNLEIGAEKSKPTIGIYHVSGTDGAATGFKTGSKARIEEGIYPITTPTGFEKWRQPGVGGPVINRGVRFHFGSNNPMSWTEGCFVLFADYSINNDEIRINMKESIKSLEQFDNALGASSTYKYPYHNYNRLGARFPHKINKILILKTR